jgi:hypothetical protein
MDQEKLVSVTISLPQTYRDRLRRMAAERNLNNPEHFTGISQLGREIICGCLKELETAKKEGQDK